MVYSSKIGYILVRLAKLWYILVIFRNYYHLVLELLNSWPAVLYTQIRHISTLLKVETRIRESMIRLINLFYGQGIDCGWRRVSPVRTPTIKLFHGDVENDKVAMIPRSTKDQ